ncbi:hypothetical protein FRC07_006779 [Ceratobasidium sp. 392]|nr:hypothetical protein FRC07_006779 [Ceratobasidium sp. 392]
MRNFTSRRHRHLVVHSSASAQANMVLVIGVPRRFLDEGALAQLLQHVPGVVKVWLNRDLKELLNVYDRHLDASKKLETAEFKLIAIDNQLYRQHNNANPRREIPKTMHYVFVGLYIQQIRMAAMFLLDRDQSNKPSSIPQGALMVDPVAITASHPSSHSCLIFILGIDWI